MTPKNAEALFIGADPASGPSALRVSFAGPVGEPAAYLHKVTHADGEQDQALSFAEDSCPFDSIVKSTSVEPLFTAEQMAIAIEIGAKAAAEHLTTRLRAADGLAVALIKVLLAERYTNVPPVTVMEAEAQLDRIRAASAAADAALAEWEKLNEG